MDQDKINELKGLRDDLFRYRAVTNAELGRMLTLIIELLEEKENTQG